jgi:hypothetical protein
MCSFCGRPRTLRTEQHQLGALVRTIVTCETCHRTLSSSMGVAGAEEPAAEATPAPANDDVEAEPAAAKPAAKPKANRAPAKPKPAGTKAKAPPKPTRRSI